MKKIFSPLLLIALIASAVYFTMTSGDDYRTIKEKGEYSTCVVKTIGGDVICSFNIEGKELTKRLSKPHESIRDGEMFKVYYYHEIPDKYYVSFREPIINEGEFSETVTSEVSKNGDYINFSYKVGIKILERYQLAVDGIEFDPNRVYKVEYKKADPRIAYLIL